MQSLVDLGIDRMFTSVPDWLTPFSDGVSAARVPARPLERTGHVSRSGSVDGGRG